MNEHQPVGNLGPSPLIESVDKAWMCADRLMSSLRGSILIWTKYVRVFCDGGQPKFYLVPRFRRRHYNVHWGLYGFNVYWLGREFNFSFGEDKKKLYG